MGMSKNSSHSHSCHNFSILIFLLLPFRQFFSVRLHRFCLHRSTPLGRWMPLIDHHTPESLSILLTLTWHAVRSTHMKTHIHIPSCIPCLMLSVWTRGPASLGSMGRIPRGHSVWETKRGRDSERSYSLSLMSTAHYSCIYLEKQKLNRRIQIITLILTMFCAACSLPPSHSLPHHLYRKFKRKRSFTDTYFALLPTSSTQRLEWTQRSSLSTSNPHRAKVMHKWSHCRWDFCINIAWPQRASFGYAQGYTDLWPQMGKPFQHLEEFIKPIWIRIEGGTCWYACGKASGMCVSGLLWNFALKAPLGHCNSFTQTPWKKTHTHTYRIRSTHTHKHTPVHDVPQRNLRVDECNQTVLMLHISSVFEKKLLFSFGLTLNTAPASCPLHILLPRGVGKRDVRLLLLGLLRGCTDYANAEILHRHQGS